jgi:hypothetical protein
MKKSTLTAVLMFTCILGLGVRARAQDADAVLVSVSVEFVVGGATLPAGDYRVSRVYPGANRELAISGNKKGNAFVLPVAFDDGPTNQPTLSFEHVSGKYFLSTIKTPSGVYTMPASREMLMLGKANSPGPSTSSASGGQ